MDWLGLGIGFGITFAGIALGMAWRARLRGNLLLDTGAMEGPVLSGNPATYLPAAILLAGAWLWRRDEGLVMMALASGGVLAVVVVFKKRTHLRFTDQGICYDRLIKWGEIGSYRWDRNPEGSEQQLEMDISMKGRSLTISYPIPSMYRERVAEILAAHVPRAS